MLFNEAKKRATTIELSFTTLFEPVSGWLDRNSISYTHT